MLRRVVVTGFGAISPNGIGKTEFWKGTCHGISGIGRIARFDPTGLSC
ncbi:MAG: beta-ketoacyl synthase, partial [Nitrospinaceae bacterium]|nr:beta-ketoacyl synthase [Nitrospinaceae bacterium]